MILNSTTEPGKIDCTLLLHPSAAPSPSIDSTARFFAVQSWSGMRPCIQFTDMATEEMFGIKKNSTGICRIDTNMVILQVTNLKALYIIKYLSTEKIARNVYMF
jgi:hypothetical protein